MSFDPISAALDIGKMAISRIWPDPAQQADAQLKLAKLAQDGNLAGLQAEVQLLVGQMSINKVEAASKSLFVSGWRPFVGWVCGFGIAWNFILQPLISWIAFLFDVDLKGAPQLDISDLMTLLLGMLGLAAQRTYEKKHNVHSNSLK
jgi:hypothetical protein|tara:strand:- start:80 stop:520 length:441 start_codon:yes stop_codon:yes gene_type:complete